MRLIDADAEIKKIEEEIKRSYKAIDRWRSGGMPGSSLYDIDEKVRRIKRNIENCRIEIKILKSYTTAYNPEAIVKKLEDKIEYAGRLMVEKPAAKLDEIANNTAEDYHTGIYRSCLRVSRKQSRLYRHTGMSLKTMRRKWEKPLEKQLNQSLEKWKILRVHLGKKKA